MKVDNIQIIKDEEVDLQALFKVLWIGRKYFLPIIFFALILGAFYIKMQTPLYKSTVSIYPSGGSEVSKISELKSMASSFGLASFNSSQSLAINDILSSQSLKKKLIYHKWNTVKYNRPVNLITYWGINDSTKSSFSISFNPINWIKSLKKIIFGTKKTISHTAFEIKASGLLSERIILEKNKTGLIKISALMEEKLLASDLANVIYDILVEFTTQSHVNKARISREFIQDRLDDLGLDLESSEETLKIFREKNRSIVQSPQLQLELERLVRNVAIHNQLYITLLEQLEVVKIKELDETPTLTVLDQAIPALGKETPNENLIMSIFFIIGCMCSLSWIFIQYTYNKN